MDGTIFDVQNIESWIDKHGTNPISGASLTRSDLITLCFAKNDDGDMVDPVTYKVFTDNTHMVALKTSGNVFAYDTVQKLNVKAKMWRDLVNDEPFTRRDVITLQDPQNVEARNLSSFKYLKEGTSTLNPEQDEERNNLGLNLNKAALGSGARALKSDRLPNPAGDSTDVARTTANPKEPPQSLHQRKIVPLNAAQFTTGRAAASLTSTGLTPHTSTERAILTDEEYMLKPKRVKSVGYARMRTSLGQLDIELYPEFAPRAVWNFLSLVQKGYYDGTEFHRSIRNFMVQGGDPTGTGKGGQSIWSKPFADELEGPKTHDERGVISMANKGKNTNGSQFFILYRPAKHLDRKHTIFGKVVGGLDILSKIEDVPVDDKDRPKEGIKIEEIEIFVDPFDEFQKERIAKDEGEKARKAAGKTDDQTTTWTGKRIRSDGERAVNGGADAVGTYLKQATPNGSNEERKLEEWEAQGFEEPASKKTKTGGFGNFDSW